MGQVIIEGNGATSSEFHKPAGGKVTPEQVEYFSKTHEVCAYIRKNPDCTVQNLIKDLPHVIAKSYVEKGREVDYFNSLLTGGVHSPIASKKILVEEREGVRHFRENPDNLYHPRMVMTKDSSGNLQTGPKRGAKKSRQFKKEGVRQSSEATMPVISTSVPPVPGSPRFKVEVFARITIDGNVHELPLEEARGLIDALSAAGIK